MGSSISILFSNIQENTAFLIKQRTGSIVGMDMPLFFVNLRIFLSSKFSLEPISKEFLFDVPLAK